MKNDFHLPQGTMLGENYQIIKEIGKGGMGTVYMAFDTLLDIRVAIKVISPDLSMTMDEAELESVLKRFQSEAKLAAKIDHPNVVRIFGFKQIRIMLDGETHDIDYLVMELLSGRTLRNTMDVSGFEYEEEVRDWICTYLIPILEGLQEVHELGIIHRDIKPENFLMKENTPKLADFGLSLGFDLPSVTATVADIFGTITYMAPEQFYNFSMAREPADIYSIGKILYEAVEGKLSKKVKPFKQVMLSSPNTEFLDALNSIIMAATEENQSRRIGSVQELKDRLMRLIHCQIGASDQSSESLFRRFFENKIMISIFLGISLLIGAVLMHFLHNPSPPIPIAAERSASSGELRKVTLLPYPESVKDIAYSEDGSILHLIPPVEFELAANNPLDLEKAAVTPVYFSENPVTNQQYVKFLNQHIKNIEIRESDVYLNGRLVLKMSEKIRGYKPIVFRDGRFSVQQAMHSSCSVLMVTGYGAEAYVDYFGMRLPRAEEWYYVMKTGGKTERPKMNLPVPVLNYEQDRYELRAINQLGEWGKMRDGGYVILGQTPSAMMEESVILEKDPTKYYTDTSFRIVRDVREGK